MLTDYLTISWKSLRQRAKRSILTAIGIIIGIAAVVALISLGQGMKDAINKQFSSIGGDKIIVQTKSAGFGPPGQQSPGKLTEHDLKIMTQVSGVKEAAGRLLKPVRIEFNKKARTQFLSSVPEDSTADLVISANNYKAAQGRMIKTSDKGKIMVGNDFAQEDAFGKEMVAGDKVIIQDRQFEVIGILDKLGDPVRDKSIVMNTKEAWDLLGITDEEYSVLVAQADAGQDIDALSDRILRAIRRDRGQKEGREDFTVQTSGEVIATFGTILTIVQVILSGIAAISLLVGGIGIMNTMYTSVLERTREIGIMKSIGARNSDVMWIFLIESSILGGIGGLIGILLGVLMSKLVELMAYYFWGPNLLQASIPWYLVLGALAFSLVIGTVSGLLPSRNASRMRPVDALRGGK